MDRMTSRANLLAAIAKARPFAEAPGIYAIYTEHCANGEWIVEFGEYADFMVRISDDDDARTMDDGAIADIILGCWDAEWNDG
jgi:hypothetical protein